MVTVGEIAAALGADFAGDGSVMVQGAAEPSAARAVDLALAMDPKYTGGLAKGQALAAMIWPGADWQGAGAEGCDLYAARAVGDGGIVEDFRSGAVAAA